MRSRPQLSAILLLAASLAACADADSPTAPARAEPKADAMLIGFGYNSTLLPILPAGISDSGVIVGKIGTNVARLYSGVITLAQRDPVLGGSYEAHGINYQGALLGRVPSGPGLFWRAAHQVPYRIVAPGNGTVIPNGLNNANVVVGSFSHVSGNPHAFRWTTSGGFEDITPPGYQAAVALDVSDGGYVVGYGWVAGGSVQALRWAPGTTAAVVLPGYGTMGTAISSGSGLAVGTADFFTTIRAWPLFGGSTTLAGPAASEPTDISNLGRVVGYTYAHSSVSPHRPWTSFNGSTTWLPVPNDAFTEGVYGLRVNTCGSIVGTQVFTNGSRQGRLWSRSFTCDIGGGVTHPGFTAIETVGTTTGTVTSTP